LQNLENTELEKHFMKLYENKSGKLSQISSQQFKLEKEIQLLIENNLEELFGLKFIKSEFKIDKFRIDTLCYDAENKSFVIIEYKKDRNFSVIDQGYTYMSLLLNHKSDFILEYIESGNDPIKRDDIDWSQSKVIFIAPSFTEYQKHSINFKDVPFELWEINKYDQNLIGFLQHKTDSKESIATVSSPNESIIKEISKEIVVYSEESHLEKIKDEKIAELYQTLKKRILEIGDEVEISPKKLYISFKSKKTFCDIIVYKDHLNLLLNLKKGELDDPKQGITKDLSKQGHWGNGDYEIKIDKNSDLDYTLFLVNQSYKKHQHI
jgi:predicted transport protein